MSCGLGGLFAFDVLQLNLTLGQLLFQLRDAGFGDCGSGKMARLSSGLRPADGGDSGRTGGGGLETRSDEETD